MLYEKCRNSTPFMVLTLPWKQSSSPDVKRNGAPRFRMRETIANLGERPLMVLTATRQDDIPPEIPPKDAQAEEGLWVHQSQIGSALDPWQADRCRQQP